MSRVPAGSIYVGTKGDPGAPGAVWRAGSGVPSNTLGINGDFYVDTQTGQSYVRTGGVYIPSTMLRGPQGFQGEQGLKGDTGDIGPQGVQGNIGPQGPQGLTGDTGATGAKGDQGDQGEKGDPGVKGDKGDKGDQGIQGETGETGATGVKGDTGRLSGIPLTWLTSTAAADPGLAGIRANNASLTTATLLYVNGADLDGKPTSALMAFATTSTSEIRGTIGIYDYTDRGNFVVYDVVGPTTNGAGWFTIPVQYRDQGGTLANAVGVVVNPVRSGDKGDTGLSGAAASLTVRNVITVSPAAPAAVRNAGTTAAAILDFDIPQGQQGATGSSPALQWFFDSGVSDTTPGTGKFRLNSLSYADATQIYIDNSEAGGNPVLGWLQTLDDSTNASARGLLTLVQVSDPNKFATYRVSGLTVDSGSGYQKIVVTHLASNGPFSGRVAFAFAPAGNRGADGLGAGDVIGSDTATDGQVAVFDGDGYHLKSGGSLAPLAFSPTAANVTFTAVGNIAATNLQAALAELDAEKLGVSALATVATSGLYGDLLGRPTLAAVATTGSFNDLTGKPSIPTDNTQLLNGSGFINLSAARAGVSAVGSTTYNATTGVFTSPTMSSLALSLAGESSTTGFRAAIGLGSVDNTSDAAKPVSTATQAALDGKLASTHAGTGGTAHAVASSGTAGFMSAADKTKLDGVASGATAYTHPSGDGNLHVPATGTTNNGSVLTAGATAGSLTWTPLSVVATTGAYADLSGKPTVPTNTNQLTNGAGFITGTALTPYLTHTGGQLTDVRETVNVLGSGSGGRVINLALGDVVTATSTGASTWAFSGAPASGISKTFTVHLTNGGAAAQTWPASVVWPNNTAPSLSSNGTDIVVFTTVNGGTTWRGAVVQKGFAS